jgi:hypothetical protein
MEAGLIGGLRRSGEMDDGVRPLFWRDGEQLRQRGQGLDQAAQPVVAACAKSLSGVESSSLWVTAYGRSGSLRTQPIHQFAFVRNLDGSAIWPVHQELLGVGSGLGVTAEGSGLQQGLTVELIDPKNEYAHGRDIAQLELGRATCAKVAQSPNAGHCR